MPNRPKIVALLGLLGLLGWFTVGAYLWLAIEELGLPDIVLRYFLASGILAGAIGTPVTWWLAKPYADVHVDPTPAAIRDALRFPARMFALTLWLWLVPCLVFPIMSVTIRPEYLDANVQVVVAGVTAAFISGIVSYYACLRIVRNQVAPALLPEGRLDHLEPFRPGKMWQHTFLLVLLLGVIAPATIATLAWTGNATAPLITYLSFDYFLVGLFVGWEVTAAISGPVGHLQERMDKVAGGDLDQKATIFGGDSMGILSSRFNSMVEGLRQREVIRETFGRYVTQQVADEILAGRVELGGERRNATVLFADIRGFTRMSEGLPPEEVVAFLNDYLGHMVGCVLDNGGVLDKFIGDAVMALFGVPVSRGAEADARAALQCALEMSQRLDDLNAERAAQGKAAIDIGIGVHSGELIAGNIGAPQRMEYTVVGDTVNVCSRIEGLTKRLGKRILLSDATAELAGEHFRLQELDTLPVKGRQRPVRLFTLLAS